jgi:hypothetical protein
MLSGLTRDLPFDRTRPQKSGFTGIGPARREHLTASGRETSSTERTVTAQRRELLIAELNHRVRNILTLIRG